MIMTSKIGDALRTLVDGQVLQQLATEITALEDRATTAELNAIKLGAAKLKADAERDALCLGREDEAADLLINRPGLETCPGWHGNRALWHRLLDYTKQLVVKLAMAERAQDVALNANADALRAKYAARADAGRLSDRCVELSLGIQQILAERDLAQAQLAQVTQDYKEYLANNFLASRMDEAIEFIRANTGTSGGRNIWHDVLDLAYLLRIRLSQADCDYVAVRTQLIEMTGQRDAARAQVDRQAATITQYQQQRDRGFNEGGEAAAKVTDKLRPGYSPSTGIQAKPFSLQVRALKRVA